MPYTNKSIAFVWLMTFGLFALSGSGVIPGRWLLPFLLVALAAPALILRSQRRVALTAAAVVYLQIVFGALLTHAGWLWLHVGGALAVFAVVPSVTARLRGSGDPVAAPIARALLVLLGLQLLLGVGSFLARFTAIWIPGGQTTLLGLPVAHRLVGSLILGAVVVLALRVSTASGEDIQAMRLGRTEPPAPGAGHPPSAAVPATPLP